jgi:hypothetical protein
MPMVIVAVSMRFSGSRWTCAAVSPRQQDAFCRLVPAPIAVTQRAEEVCR